MRNDDDRWSEDVATLRRAAEELVQRRHQHARLSHFSPLTLSHPINTHFDEVAQSLDDPSPEIRQQAVRDLYELDPDQAATLVNDALRAGSPDERRRIGLALADSGLIYEAINDLMAENHESCYGAFSLLFLVAKAGVVEPLTTIIENHPSVDLSLAVIRLLASSRQHEVVPALQRLAASPTLEPELRSAALEAVQQINT